MLFCILYKNSPLACRGGLATPGGRAMCSLSERTLAAGGSATWAPGLFGDSGVRNFFRGHGERAQREGAPGWKSSGPPFDRKVPPQVKVGVRPLGTEFCALLSILVRLQRRNKCRTDGVLRFCA